MESIPYLKEKEQVQRLFIIIKYGHCENFLNFPKVLKDNKQALDVLD